MNSQLSLVLTDFIIILIFFTKVINMCMIKVLEIIIFKILKRKNQFL